MRMSPWSVSAFGIRAATGAESGRPACVADCALTQTYGAASRAKATSDERRELRMGLLEEVALRRGGAFLTRRERQLLDRRYGAAAQDHRLELPIRKHVEHAPDVARGR